MGKYSILFTLELSVIMHVDMQSALLLTKKIISSCQQPEIECNLAMHLHQQDTEALLMRRFTRSLGRF